MLMHTREGKTIVTQQEKLKTKPDNRWTIYFKGSALFDPFCCRESFITVNDLINPELSNKRLLSTKRPPYAVKLVLNAPL